MMETQPQTPRTVFMFPQRLVVPLFQRPYVWNREHQWEPLWKDVQRVTERYLANPTAKHQPHFLGAVVVQQVLSPTGSMQERSIIDGQQRLTTLQLLLDAIHAEAQEVGAVQPAVRLETLVVNGEAFRERPEDRHKVWPTNKDRPAFNEVMSAPSPVDHASLTHRSTRLVQAHAYFSDQVRAWLRVNGDEDAVERATALEKCVSELLQMVVIDLNPDENAQEIFETLNARGAVLTSADLIKNFVFQRLLETGADVEAVYEKYWKQFETAFWETEISSGRVLYPRSSMFLNHWLMAKTGEEIVAREVFSRFKTYVIYETTQSIGDLIVELHDAAAIYRAFIEAASAWHGPLDRLGLFAYRTSTMESEVIKPLVLHLLDPSLTPVPAQQLDKALATVESWMVRRMLIRATGKSYTQVVVEILTELMKNDRARAGDVLEQWFAGQRGENRYWPDDREVSQHLTDQMVYRKLRRGRLRMVLEAIEDHQRGWTHGKPGFSERVTRGSYHVEHVMPQKWQTNWPLPRAVTEQERDQLVHTLGNLTLLTSRLNLKVSNGPWHGVDGKRAHLKAHDVLTLNRPIVDHHEYAWTEADIQARTSELIDAILEVWPVPEGHQSGHAVTASSTVARTIDVADLVTAGLLAPGTALVPTGKKYSDHRAIVLADGSLEVAEKQHRTPTAAAMAITGGKSVNGWVFFLVQESPRVTLSDLWHQYVDATEADVDDSDVDAEGISDDTEVENA